MLCTSKIELLTSALNVYVDNNEKMSNIKEYIKSQGIEIKGIKFGKSKAQYFMDKDENAIYQGISSIKYCKGENYIWRYRIQIERHCNELC